MNWRVPCAAAQASSVRYSTGQPLFSVGSGGSACSLRKTVAAAARIPHRSWKISAKRFSDSNVRSAGTPPWRRCAGRMDPLWEHGSRQVAAGSTPAGPRCRPRTAALGPVGLDATRAVGLA